MVHSKKIKKGILSITDSGITLTNNEIKDIIKIVKFFRRIALLKRTITKITSQKGGFINFQLALSDNWFTINEKCTRSISLNVFDSIRIISRNVSSRCSY